jgi:hypothetical protein
MTTISHARWGLRRPLFAAALVVGLWGGNSSRAELLDVVDLPKPSDETPIELGTIPAAEVAKCTLRVITPATDYGPVGNAYTCEPDGGAWKIVMSKTSPVATLQFDKDRLLFHWDRAATRSASAGLRNCLLQVGYGAKTKMITLRRPVRVAAKLLDLRRDKDAFSPDLDDLPEAETMSLEVFGLSGYETPVTFDPENKQAPIKSPVRILLKPAGENTPGVEILVTLNKLGSKLSVDMEPVAVTADGGNTRPFTVKSISDALDRTKSRLSTSKSKLAAAEKQIVPLEAKLGSMNTSAVRSAKQKTAFESQLSKLQGQLDTAKQKADELRKQVPALQTQLEILPELAKMANDLNQHAAVEFRVLSAIGRQQIVLLATEKAPLEAPLPPKDENAEGAPPP